MKFLASFGQWLMLRRQALHVQRTELAARIGCAVVTLRKIETDERRPSRQLAEQLATHLAIADDEREVFIRVARGELAVDRLDAPMPEVPISPSLPVPTTSLVGRAREIENVRSLLSRPDVRLLTLTGAPGVGKTRLAREAVATMPALFGDGVCFVDLSSLSDPDLVLVAVAHAMHVGLSGKQSLSERLGRYLQPKRVLLVLDNFEHMLRAAPCLSPLLSAAPRLKLLVTSRVALELSGEHRFTVLPFGVPPDADTWKHPLSGTEAQQRYAAIDLFVQRARAVAPGFALADADVPAVADICRRLDGLPLAIELAAVRAALFTPQELLAGLNDRFALLTGGARDLSARHATLRHAIDWSYGLLSPPEQQLLRRLSVFVGGCTVQAVQNVCNDDGAIGNDVVDEVSTLVASSLLQRYVGYDGRSRFRMLETVRDYALQQLVNSGEAEIMRCRHAAYYLALAEAAQQEWDRPDEWDWLRRLVSVRDNLQAALRWAIDTRDAALSLRLTGALFKFLTTCSPLTEARSWIEAVLVLAESNHAPELRAAKAKVLNVAGYVALETSDYPQASIYFARGLALYRALGDERGVAWSMRGCALVHVHCDQDAAAEQLLYQSLELCQSSGDAWGEAWSLYALAFLRLAQHDLVLARHALEHALVDLRKQNMTFGVFRALLALGDTLLEQGDDVGAERRFREALMLSQKTPLLTFITIGLDGMAMVMAARGQPLRAARLWGAAEALREATGEEPWPVFQRAIAAALAAARKEVSETAWATAWTAGRALTAEDAVTEALGEADAPVEAEKLEPLVVSGVLLPFS